MGNIYKEKEQLLEDITLQLNTHDKRFMFLKILFPQVVKFINLEGSSVEVSTSIISEFHKRGLVNDLEDKINIVFNGKSN